MGFLCCCFSTGVYTVSWTFIRMNHKMNMPNHIRVFCLFIIWRVTLYFVFIICLFRNKKQKNEINDAHRNCVYRCAWIFSIPEITAMLSQWIGISPNFTLFVLNTIYSSDFLFQFCSQIVYIFYNPTDSGAVQLKSDNLDMTLGK